MKTLHDLQRAFAADLLSDDLSHMRGLILDDRLSAARRLNVYRNNFRMALTEALAAVYPVVGRLVGRDFFDFVTDKYISEHPPRSGNLHDLGRMMPGFLDDFEAISQLPYLTDVARLEWAYHTVFHAAAPPPFEPIALQQVAAERFAELRFDIGPACRLVRSIYPIFRIWKVNQENYTGDKTVNLDEGPDSVLIVRPELEVELWRLDPAEFEFLTTIENGGNFGEAVEASLRHSCDFDLQSVLTRYLTSGVLTMRENRAPRPEKVSAQAIRQQVCAPAGRPI